MSRQLRGPTVQTRYRQCSFLSRERDGGAPLHRGRYMAAKRFYNENTEVMNFCGYLAFVILFSVAVNANSHGEEFQVCSLCKAPSACLRVLRGHASAPPAHAKPALALVQSRIAQCDSSDTPHPFLICILRCCHLSPSCNAATQHGGEGGSSRARMGLGSWCVSRAPVSRSRVHALTRRGPPAVAQRRLSWTLHSLVNADRARALRVRVAYEKQHQTFARICSTWTQ